MTAPPTVTTGYRTQDPDTGDVLWTYSAATRLDHVREVDGQ